MSRQPSIKQLSQAVDMYLASRKAKGGVSDYGGAMSGGAMCGGAVCCKQCGGSIFQRSWWDKRFNPGKYDAEQKAKRLESELAAEKSAAEKERERISVQEQMRRKILDEQRYVKGRGGSINLQPRPKRGGELTVPRQVQPANSFFGSGVSGGRMRRLAGMGVSGGAGGSTWVQHVKRVAAQEGISYKDALKVASESYRGGAMCGGAFMGTMSDPVGDRHL